MQNNLNAARDFTGSNPSDGMKRRVLLLADPDLSSALKAWLVRLGFDVFDGRETTTDPNERGYGCDWLASKLFPSSKRSTKMASAEDRWQPLYPKLAGALKLLGRAGKEERKDEPATLFRWGEFDVVILQDLWLTSEAEANASVVPLGCVLAFDDYYLRANFSGRKIVMVTDPGFFNKVTPGASLSTTLASLFDQNGQITYIPLVGDSAVELPLWQLKRALDRKSGWEAPVLDLSRIAQELLDYRDSLLNNSFSRLIKQLREYIFGRAHVVLIDDNPETIKDFFECLSFVASPASEWAKTGHVLVLSLDAQAVPTFFRNFSELVEHCKALLKPTTTGDKNLLFVTDILFDRVQWIDNNWRFTGIQLIEELRKVQERFRSVGVVAFTGLSTPFITTPAYQLGADAVVFKAADPVAVGHSHLSPRRAGIDRLLLMLAFLCFQREFLREKRMAEHENAGKELEHLKQVLPRHSVSPHIREEWNDTFYILEGLRTYSVAPEEFEAIRTGLMEKYD
jgi:hypothetical protein